MKSKRTAFVALVTAFLLAVTGLGAAKYVPGDLIVRLNPGTLEMPGNASAQFNDVGITGTELIQVLNAYNVKSVERAYWNCDISDPLSDVYLFKLDENLDMERAADALMNLPCVVYAGPNYIAKLQVTPNDPYFNLQWGLNNTNPNYPDNDINAPEAWSLQTSYAGPLIAVLDAGLAAEHYDNPGDEFYGRIEAFWNGPWGTDDIREGPYAGHGTHVTGIAAASTNNNLGIAGVAGGWYSGKTGPRLLIAKIGEDEEDELSAVNAIKWAKDNGALVITGSFGWDQTNPINPTYLWPLFEACTLAFQTGASLFFPAGNHPLPYPGDICYPAKFASYDICSAVGSMDVGGQRAGGEYGSAIGPELSFLAPGVHIYSTTVAEDGYYAYKTGTSMASPHAAGVAALLYCEAKDNGIAPMDVDIKRIMEYTSRDITEDGEFSTLCGPGWDPITGWGLIRADAALRRLNPPYVLEHGAILNQMLIGVGYPNVEVTFTNKPNRNNAPGVYRCNKYKLSGWAYFSRQMEDLLAWGRILDGAPGYSNENPNDAWYYVEVVPPPQTPTGAVEVVTYVYELLYRKVGSSWVAVDPQYKWAPRDPSRLALAITWNGIPVGDPWSAGLDESPSIEPAFTVDRVTASEFLLNFQLPNTSTVSITVFDVTGRQVKNLISGEQTSGEHQLTWYGVDDAGRNVSSGVYIVHMKAGDFQAREKVTLIR